MFTFNAEDFVQERQLKIVMLGEPASGKTNLILRYCHDEFSRQYYPTTGVDIYLKRTLVEGHSMRLIIWDTSGSSLSANNLFDKYIHDADVIIFTFDITNITSFGALNAWHQTTLSCTGQSSILFVLVANKCDVEHQRAVSIDKQNKFATDNRMISFNVSSRTGENVNGTFQRIIACIIGIKLSKQAIDTTRNEVNAEIFVNQSRHVPTTNHIRSSICNLQ